MDRRVGLWVEFALLYAAVPVLFAMRTVPLPILPSMWVIALACGLYLSRSRTFAWRAAWRVPRPRYHMRGIWLTFFALAPLMVAMFWSLEPRHLFSLPRHRPNIWIMVMCFYPWLSVVPQTIIWRGFLLHRYRPLIGSGWPAALIATCAFSFAHLYFLNPIALLVTFVGGLLFIMTYMRTRSLLLSALEHAMFGCWAFTVGYGRFLYAGPMG